MKFFKANNHSSTQSNSVFAEKKMPQENEKKKWPLLKTLC